MKRLSKGVLVLAVTSIALIGCKEEGGAGGELSINNVTLKSPTYEITANDKAVMATITEVALEGFETGSADFNLRSLTTNSVSTVPRAFVSRVTQSETSSCETGSQTMTASSNDINETTGEMNKNGTVSVSISFNSCFESGNEYDLLLSGSTIIDMTWRGYSSSTGEFDSLIFSMNFNDFTSTKTNTSNSTSEVAMVDGVLKMKMTESDITMAWALSLSGPDTNGQIVTTKTTENVVASLSGQESSGAWIVNGANDSKAEVSIEANGFEISINGGQAELI